MTEHERESIAENERTPMSDAADEVEIGPDALNEEDEQQTEPQGTRGAVEPKTDEDGKPLTPPGRSSQSA